MSYTNYMIFSYRFYLILHFMVNVSMDNSYI